MTCWLRRDDRSRSGCTTPEPFVAPDAWWASRMFAWGPSTGVLVATRALRYLWASPNTALGLVGVLIAAMSGGRVRAVDGVLEASGGWLDFLLRAAFPVPGGALAMALGHVVLGRSDEALARTRRHERVHVEQSERWGLLFVPAYLLASVWALVRGGHAYLDNVFERDARRRAGD